MNGLLTQLKEVLRAEAGLYRLLSRLLRAERDEIALGRPAGIQAAAASKKGLLSQIEVQEKRRMSVLDQLAVRLNRPVEELTLAFLAGQAKAQEASLLNLRAELLGQLAQVREENRRSEMICRHAAEVMQGSLRLLQGAAAAGAVYRPNGRLESGRLSGRLLCGEL